MENKEWREEFDKKFPQIHNVKNWIYENCYCDENPQKCDEIVKDFIQSLLDKQAEKQREIKINYPSFDEDEWYGDIWRCSACRGSHIWEGFSFCPDCGTSIKWDLTNNRDESNSKER